MALKSALPNDVDHLQLKIDLPWRRANLSEIDALVSTLRAETKSVIIRCGDSYIADEVSDLAEARRDAVNKLSLVTSEPSVVVNLYRYGGDVSTTEDEESSRDLTRRVAKAIEKWRPDPLAEAIRIAFLLLGLGLLALAAWAAYYFATTPHLMVGADNDPKVQVPASAGDRVGMASVSSFFLVIFALASIGAFRAVAKQRRIIVTRKTTSAQNELLEKILVGGIGALIGALIGLVIHR